MSYLQHILMSHIKLNHPPYPLSCLSFIVFYPLRFGRPNIIIIFVADMGIDSNIPQIATLRKAIEGSISFPLSVHGDFLKLSLLIGQKIGEHISESTLERVWGYSTRHYDTVSVRTLNVLCRFIGKGSWKEFCDDLKGILSGDSELFASTAVFSSDLSVGSRLKLGWLPDRICIIRYLGDNRFVAEETLNATIQPGDTFSCTQFQKGLSVCMDNFIRACDQSTACASSHESLRYIVGQRSGLTLLEVL